MEQTNTIAMVLVSSIALTQESYIPLDVDNKEEDQRSAIKWRNNVRPLASSTQSSPLRLRMGNSLGTGQAAAGRARQLKVIQAESKPNLEATVVVVPSTSQQGWGLRRRTRTPSKYFLSIGYYIHILPRLGMFSVSHLLSSEYVKIPDGVLGKSIVTDQLEW